MEKLRVLIVDDEKMNIKMLKNVLEQDYIVQASLSGPQALEIITETFPDLILLDIIMPEMDGYSLCKELKANEVTHNIPIIFITTRNESEDEAKGFKMGAVDYITKPFNPTIVKARVKTHLDLKVYRDHLEKLVVERTAELEKKAIELKETITTLNVLISQREDVQKKYNQKMLYKMNDLLLPLLKKMKSDKLPASHKNCLDIIESNLKKLFEPFALDIHSKHYGLTPTEIQIANLIRGGNSTKEIADLLSVTVGTIKTHRDNIRIKLGIKNKKVNLQIHLLEMQRNRYSTKGASKFLDLQSVNSTFDLK